MKRRHRKKRVIIPSWARFNAFKQQLQSIHSIGVNGLMPRLTERQQVALLLRSKTDNEENVLLNSTNTEDINHTDSILLMTDDSTTLMHTSSSMMMDDCYSCTIDDVNPQLLLLRDEDHHHSILIDKHHIINGNEEEVETPVVKEEEAATKKEEEEATVVKKEATVVKEEATVAKKEEATKKEEMQPQERTIRKHSSIILNSCSSRFKLKLKEAIHKLDVEYDGRMGWIKNRNGSTNSRRGDSSNKNGINMNKYMMKCNELDVLIDGYLDEIGMKSREDGWRMYYHCTLIRLFQSYGYAIGKNGSKDVISICNHYNYHLLSICTQLMAHIPYDEECTPGHLYSILPIQLHDIFTH